MIKEEDDDEEHCDEHIDPEGPDPSDMDYSDEPDLEVCPYCRKLVSEEAEQCPHCREYISAENAPLSRVAWGLIIAGAVTLIAFLLTHL